MLDAVKRTGAALIQKPAKIEICGYGLVEAKDPTELPPELQAALSYASPLLKRRVAELGASSEPSDRAVALRHEAALIQWSTFESATLGNTSCA